MDPEQAMNAARQATETLLKITAAPLLAALAVGLIISLLQALTQIQESTLAAVPKFVVTLLVLLFTLPFMAEETADLMTRAFEAISASGGA